MARKKNKKVDIDTKALIDLVKLQYEQVCGARLAREWASKTKPPKDSGVVKEPDTKEGMFRLLEGFKRQLKFERENDGPLECERYLPQEVIDYIGAVNRVSIFGAWHCAERLASDENEAGSGLLSAEMARTFLYLFEQLTRMTESASREDSNDAAMYLGICAMTYYVTETGKTLGQVAVSNEGRKKGGHGTRLLATSKDQDILIEEWNKNKDADDPVTMTARALFNLGKKGRGGKKPISKKSLTAKLEAADIEVPRRRQRKR